MSATATVSKRARKSAPPDGVLLIMDTAAKVSSLTSPSSRLEPAIQWTMLPDNKWRVRTRSGLEFCYSQEIEPEVLEAEVNLSSFFKAYSIAVDLEATIAQCDERFKEYVGIPEVNGISTNIFDVLSRGGSIARETLARFLIRDIPRLCDEVRDANIRFQEALTWSERLSRLLDYIEIIEREPGSFLRRLLDQQIWKVSAHVVDGVVRLRPDYFTAAFEGIQLSRIKKCEDCGKVFWLRRAHAVHVGCSPGCSNRLRVRKNYEKMSVEDRKKNEVDRVLKEVEKEQNEKRRVVR